LAALCREPIFLARSRDGLPADGTFLLGRQRKGVRQEFELARTL